MSTEIKDAIITLDPPIVDEENDFTITTIDLNQLMTLDIASDEEINGIVYSNTPVPISTIEHNTIGVQYRAYIKNEQVMLRGDVTHNNAPIFCIEKPMDIDQFIMEIRQLIANHDIINIEKIEAIKSIIDEVKAEIYATAFSENILLCDEEFNYRIELYDSATKKHIGVANRIVLHNELIYLQEAILFDNNTDIQRIDINIVLNEDEMISIQKLFLYANSGTSFKYLMYESSDCNIMLMNHKGSMDHKTLNFKGITLPAFNTSTASSLDELLKANDQNVLLKCYKKNRKIDAIIVNINKYLLG